MAGPSFTHSSLLVLAGGGFGSWLRFAVSRVWLAAVGPVAASAFPWATLTVNVTGSLAMGLLAGWLAHHNAPDWGLSHEHWRLTLGVGVLGGFTTFSSFALEFGLFVQRNALPQAALYVGATLLAGFAALFAGLYTARSFA